MTDRRFLDRRFLDRLPDALAGARIDLRALRRGDLARIVELAGNADVSRYTATMPHPYGEADGIAFLDTLERETDHRTWAIVTDDALIGVIGLIDRGAGSPVEVGYWLGRPFWQKGLMGEALGLVLETLDINEPVALQAEALELNAGSLRVLERAGFTRTSAHVSTSERHRGRTVIHFERRAGGGR